MPGYPAPVGPNAGLPTFWNAVLQALSLTQAQVAALMAGSTQGNLVDGNGNIIEIAGTNLNQIVTIGAAWQVSGVQVGTNLTGAGRAKQTSLATGTMTLTAGSTSATLVTNPFGTFAVGQVIGAANVSDPSSGVATPAISAAPATTILGISGATVTLSQNAAESGTALYCAACNFTLL